MLVLCMCMLLNIAVHAFLPSLVIKLVKEPGIVRKMNVLLIFGWISMDPVAKPWLCLCSVYPWIYIAVHTSTSSLPAKILPAKIGLKYLTNIDIIHTYWQIWLVNYRTWSKTMDLWCVLLVITLHVHAWITPPAFNLPAKMVIVNSFAFLSVTLLTSNS